MWLPGVARDELDVLVGDSGEVRVSAGPYSLSIPGAAAESFTEVKFSKKSSILTLRCSNP